MRFLHCEKCRRTARVSPAPGDDSVEARFRAAHAECGVLEYEPTGLGTAGGPWHDPMSRRRIQVRGDRGSAVAIGRRTILDDPLEWHIEPGETTEDLAVELDRVLFWTVVDRTLFPHHLPRRALEGWASQIEHLARSARPSDIVLLDDDPATGDVTWACFTVTARARLEAGLAAFGFDPTTEERLRTLFDDELFPPLRVRRRLLPFDAGTRRSLPGGPALTR